MSKWREVAESVAVVRKDQNQELSGRIRISIRSNQEVAESVTRVIRKDKDQE